MHNLSARLVFLRSFWQLVPKGGKSVILYASPQYISCTTYHPRYFFRNVLFDIFNFTGHAKFELAMQGVLCFLVADLIGNPV